MHYLLLLCPLTGLDTSTLFPNKLLIFNASTNTLNLSSLFWSCLITLIWSKRKAHPCHHLRTWMSFPFAFTFAGCTPPSPITLSTCRDGSGSNSTPRILWLTSLTWCWQWWLLCRGFSMLQRSSCAIQKARGSLQVFNLLGLYRLKPAHHSSYPPTQFIKYNICYPDQVHLL